MIQLTGNGFSSKKRHGGKIFFYVLNIHILVVLFVFFLPEILHIFRKQPKFKLHKIRLITLSAPNISSKSDFSPYSNPPVQKINNRKNFSIKPKSTKKIYRQKSIRKNPTKKKSIIRTAKKKVKRKIKKRRVWKALNPEEILKNQKMIVKRHETQEQISRQPLVFSADALKNKLNKIRSKFENIKTSSTSGQFLPSSYLEAVSAMLYSLWQQPGKAELNGRNPYVKIRLFVTVTGKIKRSMILQKSGIRAMDNSVYDLLKRLTKLPPPPNGELSMDIILKIRPKSVARK